MIRYEKHATRILLCAGCLSISFGIDTLRISKPCSWLENGLTSWVSGGSSMLPENWHLRNSMEQHSRESMGKWRDLVICIILLFNVIYIYLLFVFICYIQFSFDAISRTTWFAQLGPRARLVPILPPCASDSTPQIPPSFPPLPSSLLLFFSSDSLNFHHLFPSLRGSSPRERLEFPQRKAVGGGGMNVHVLDFAERGVVSGWRWELRMIWTMIYM